jgi:hypothetical protein
LARSGDHRIANAPPSSSTTAADASESASGVKKNAIGELHLAHIRQLRKQGRVEAADAAWFNFRKWYPDYPVAPEDTARPSPDGS